MSGQLLNFTQVKIKLLEQVFITYDDTEADDSPNATIME